MQPGDSDTKSRHHRHKRKLLGRLLVGCLLLAAIACSVVLFVKYRQAIEANPKTIERRTIQQVGNIVEVPDEEPGVVTVLDASKLTNKTLVSRAKTNDKLLVYAKHKRIIIFRPASGKVVDMLTIQDAASTTQDAAVEVEPAQ